MRIRLAPSSAPVGSGRPADNRHAAGSRMVLGWEPVFDPRHARALIFLLLPFTVSWIGRKSEAVVMDRKDTSDPIRVI
jgi:hypothetical protein